MPRLPRSVGPPLPPVQRRYVERTDFSDAESQRVLAAAACAIARELGRQAAREFFNKTLGKLKGI